MAVRGGERRWYARHNLFLVIEYERSWRWAGGCTLCTLPPSCLLQNEAKGVRLGKGAGGKFATKVNVPSPKIISTYTSG
jgi:hypothetical protein